MDLNQSTLIASHLNIAPLIVRDQNLVALNVRDLIVASFDCEEPEFCRLDSSDLKIITLAIRDLNRAPWVER